MDRPPTPWAPSDRDRFDTEGRKNPNYTAEATIKPSHHRLLAYVMVTWSSGLGAQKD